MTAGNFARCLKALLVHEGGNDDDPQDPGGRTSRGITQSEYNAWRFAHSLQTRDVWLASDDEVQSIYRAEYWDRLHCDDLPAGIDYAVFDFGVNSGIGRSASALQGIVGTKKDGAIGPQTIAAVKQQDAASVIIELCDGRLAWLRTLKTWDHFGKGWATRVNDVKGFALQMAAPTTPQPDENPIPIPPMPPDVEPPPFVVPITRPPNLWERFLAALEAAFSWSK